MFSASATARAEVRYNITNLGALPNRLYTAGEAYAVNGAGLAVGASRYTNSNYRYHAVLFDNGNVIDLGTLGGNHSEAYGINDAGRIVGEAMTAGGERHAFVHAGATMVDLNTLVGPASGWTLNSANAINDNGWIVGQGVNPAGQKHPYLYNGGSVTDLGVPGFSGGEALAVNEVGQVAGICHTPTGYRHAFLYGDGTTTDLGSLDVGSPSVAYGINDAGQVVGESYWGTGSRFVHAVIWEGGNMIDLGSLDGRYGRSSARDINNAGDIVGWTDTPSGRHPFIYSDGVMTDLTTLVDLESGWQLQFAAGINDGGQIVGYGFYANYANAFLLTPIPEPATLSLMALGLGALIVRRQKK